MSKEPSGTGRLQSLDLCCAIPDKDTYEQELKRLQLKLLTIQQAYVRDGRRAVIGFEGWDAAGKGGSIKRMTERLDPHAYKVWPIGPPKPEEQGRHWLWRIWERLPEPGIIAIYDRTWYGRVLVERVEELTPKPDWRRAYREINDFEYTLTANGARLVKLFLHVSRAEQRQRLIERIQHPLKRYKIGEPDLRNYRLRKPYERAIEDMLAETDSKHAPWHLIPAEKKWYARISALRIVTDRLAKGVDLSPSPLDEDLKRDAERSLGVKLGKDGRVKE
ncbi:MAG: polyphosphate kinase [Proteobacteria bacterium]|nr:polyphosphate kinase [Pseudomonadota bacterium]MBI3499125.1 polyphosphate kinase [Pseudomonadota bacterium]